MKGIQDSLYRFTIVYNRIITYHFSRDTPLKPSNSSLSTGQVIDDLSLSLYIDNNSERITYDYIVRNLKQEF